MRAIILFAILLAMLSSCATLPKNKQSTAQIVAVGPGPEDMVVDTISERPRLLISCNERREGEPYYAEIFVYYPADGSHKLLQRTNEPADLSFNPHGIDLVKVGDTLVLLVVNHEREKHINSILRYRVTKDQLYFLGKIVDPLISSPNAVTGLQDGTILVSNDAKKHGSIWEPLLKLKRAQIIYWDHNKCSVASQKYCYSNGITNRSGKVYLASTLQNKVWQFDFDNGKMINKTVVAKVKGGDNIRFDGDNLLVACHLRFIDFLKHMKHPEHNSPTTVYSINPQTHKAEVVFFDSGKQISAGSTAVRYNNNLYVTGVFDAKMAIKK